MIETVDVCEELGLEDYASVVYLEEAVRSLRSEAAAHVAHLRDRKVWMVNSTSRGGGVAEMLPKLVTFLRDLGVDIDWVVMGTTRQKFFVLTKRLHNLIHGSGEPRMTAEDVALYEAVSRENAAEFESRLRPEDILVIHDPQPLGMGSILRKEVGLRSIFRCHIGLDEDLPQTRCAWDFLRPYAETFDHSVFSAPEYVPDFLEGRSGIIRPAIDPLGMKNRELTPQKLVGILSNSRLAVEHQPVVPLPFAESAKRLGPDGNFLPADDSGGIGILFRPIITQISRWDRLKGFKPLLDGFVHLKGHRARKPNGVSERHRRRLELVRLVLAGPDPSAVADDPEGQEVLGELVETYRGLPPAVKDDVAIVTLPMTSRRENELMVNALQRCSSIVVQNSLREGFGLTVTEAMWKQSPILGSKACGIRQQINDGVEGRLLQDSEDPEDIAAHLDGLLEDVPARVAYGRNAQRRVFREFLVFNQALRWLELLAGQVTA